MKKNKVNPLFKAEVQNRRGFLVMAGAATAAVSLAFTPSPLLAGPTIVGRSFYCPIDRRYYVLSSTPDQWSDGFAVCANSSFAGRKGQLAVVNRLDVRDWLVANIGRMRPGLVWLAGFRVGTSFVWQRPRGQASLPVDMSSQYWKAGEPNNRGGRENGLAMSFDDNGRFVDVSTQGAYFYLGQF